jgi:PhnB protein
MTQSTTCPGTISPLSKGEPMSKSKVRAVPEGFHTITPHLVIHGAAAAIEFYQKVFGASSIMCMPGPGGKVMHAELKFGDSILFMADDFPEMGSFAPSATGSSPVGINLYVEDCDKIFNLAVANGAKVQMPPMDMFWGDRYAKFVDPFGHNWAVATHIEDVPPEEMAKRAEAAMAQFGKK